MAVFCHIPLISNCLLLQEQPPPRGRLLWGRSSRTTFLQALSFAEASVNSLTTKTGVVWRKTICRVADVGTLLTAPLSRRQAVYILERWQHPDAVESDNVSPNAFDRMLWASPIGARQSWITASAEVRS